MASISLLHSPSPSPPAYSGHPPAPLPCHHPHIEANFPTVVSRPTAAPNTLRSSGNHELKLVPRAGQQSRFLAESSLMDNFTVSPLLAKPFDMADLRLILNKFRVEPGRRFPA